MDKECNNILMNVDSTKISPNDSGDICLTPSIISIDGDISLNEKCDQTPENSKKSDDISPDLETNLILLESSVNTTSVPTKEINLIELEPVQYNYRNPEHISKSISLNEMLNERKSNVDDLLQINEISSPESPQQPQAASLAFTIDFGGAKLVDNQRYKNMVERFQSRHKRGVSLSKLEEENQNKKITTATGKVIRAPMSAKLPRRQMLPINTGNSESSFSSEQEETSKVKLRDKNLSFHKEANKRHSWSPRTSMHEPTPIVNKQTPKFTPRSATLTLALDNLNNKVVPPRSLDFVCPAPPLDILKISDEEVSEAGTYTLDGDNYTEEQKQKMDIDKQRKENEEKLRRKKMDEQLEIIDLDEEEINVSLELDKKRKNILEISCCHTESTVKPKISYLEKIKSRVKNYGEKTFHKAKSPEKISIPPSQDLGCFTSVTASGIFSSKTVPDKNPKLTRRNSLTKSQIDNSEYVQGISRLNLKNDKKLLNCEIRCTNNDFSTNNSIKTAATKNDWIQEWAKNAREYAQSPQKRPSHQNLKMSQSYDSETQNQFGDNNDDDDDDYRETQNTKSDYYEEEFGDNLEKNYARNRYHDNHAIEYNTDSNLKYNQSRKQFLAQNNENYYNEYNNELTSPRRKQSLLRDLDANSSDGQQYYVGGNYDNSNINNRPPLSPSRIPSPMHSMGRARSASRNRSLHGSNTDLTTNDTQMFLQKTAAAISSLQNIHHQNSLNNSPRSPASPNYKNSPKISPIHTLRSPIRTRMDDLSPEEYYFYKQQQQLQQKRNRNLSLDGTEYHPKLNYSRNSNSMSNSYNTDGLNGILDFKKSHTRHHSYEGMSPGLPPKPMKAMQNFDQTTSHYVDNSNVAMRTNQSNKQQKTLPTTNFNKKLNSNPVKQNSPIKRSSSFSVKALSSQSSTFTPKMTPKVAKNNNTIQKSASSTSFRKMYDNSGNGFYLNDDDDLDPGPGFSSESDYSDKEYEVDKQPIINTRYNKTFLMRLEQNKKPAPGIKQGVVACPNTPELSRRDTNVRSSFRDRSSMPRDSSLSRMKQEISNFNTTKKTLSTAPAHKTVDTGNKDSRQKILPKYLDISKYKPAQGNNFLKRDESKSYLVHKEVKRSPSSASVTLTRNDPTRMSNRSVKSAGAKSNSSSIANKEALALKKAKEAELAMWKRRASYDPMKAAAEGKKKMEEAKKMTQQQQSKFNDSSIVLRSQSFHSGVNPNGMSNPGANSNENNRWTLTSTESSDEDFTTTS